MYIDSHAHLLPEYYEREIFSQVLKNNSNIIINIVGYDLESSYNAINIANRNEFFFASCGFHPYDVSKIDKNSILKLREILLLKKVIALGEIGLDYFRDITDFALQREKFAEQIQIAKEKNLPLIIHSRNSFRDTIDILREIGYFSGVFHSFDYSEKELKELIELGFFVSYSGMATFSKRQDLRDAMYYTPIDRVLFETDSPYLTPEPYRGKINFPTNVIKVYELFSEVKRIPLEELEKIVFNNFVQLFKIETKT